MLNGRGWTRGGVAFGGERMSSRSNARRIGTWAGMLVAVAGAAAMQVNTGSFYVNGSCGDNAWTGTGSACSAESG